MMKTQTVVAMALVAVLAAGTLWQGSLQADAMGAAKIAVVDITYVLENSQKHKSWQQKMEREQQQAREEFGQMRRELEHLDDQLRVLRRGSDDYLRIAREFAEKKGVFDARNSFYEDKVNAQMQSWTEELYQTLMGIVESVAKQKGIDLVLAKEQLDVPAPSLRDFMLTLKTRKVLFNNDKLDITAEVLAALDSQK